MCGASWLSFDVRPMKKRSISDELPDRFTVISVDEDAKAFLVAAGIFGEFGNNVAFRDVHVAHWTHSTHWVFAMACQESPQNQKRGFIVAAWPKNRYSRDQFIEEVGKAFPIRFDADHRVISRTSDEPLS